MTLSLAGVGVGVKEKEEDEEGFGGLSLKEQERWRCGVAVETGFEGEVWKWKRVLWVVIVASKVLDKIMQKKFKDNTVHKSMFYIGDIKKKFLIKLV